jgi:chemotaxis protein CheD
MRRAGAGDRMEAVLTGGARMFELGSELDIGARNEAAVRSALADARIIVAAAATGGNRGRTVKVQAGTGTVSVREAGGETVTLFGEDVSRGPRARSTREVAAGARG